MEIIDGKRCHFSSNLRRSAALFSSTLGIPGLSRSHFVNTIVNGVSCSMSQFAYRSSFSVGGTLASTNKSTPARFSLRTK